MKTSARLSLIRSTYFARLGASALGRYFALASVAAVGLRAPSHSDIDEETSLAYRSHNRNGSDSIVDEEIEGVTPSIHDPLARDERETFALSDERSLLRPTERAHLRRATARNRARIGA